MTVELSELSLHLGDFIQKAQAGELVIIRSRGRSIAELHPPQPSDSGEGDIFPLPIDETVSDIHELRCSGPRPFGLCKGQFEVTDAFFEPLPDDLLRAFNGKDPDPLLDNFEPEK